MLEAAWTIAVRELVAFFRQRSRVLAAIITPLFLWLMLGMGMGQSFRWEHGGGGFLAYFFPGIVVFAVVFAGIYSSISTILDRQKGILQSVVVAPISRTSIVFGKVLGGTLIALVEGSILLLFVRLAGIPAGAVEVVLAIAVLALLCYAMTGIGFFFAWMIDSVQGYHAIMNLILMPAWLLSGAFFPRDGAATWVRVAMDVNPLYYGLSALRHVLWLEDEVMRNALPSLWICLAVTGGLGLVMTVLSARAVTKKTL
ncbi:MAG: ABC transporter permease [Planctomycetes bacterium]|nr:ABC transporter permease [Planctomycetota bacterium]